MLFFFFHFSLFDFEILSWHLVTAHSLTTSGWPGLLTSHGVDSIFVVGQFFSIFSHTLFFGVDLLGMISETVNRDRQGPRGRCGQTAALEASVGITGKGAALLSRGSGGPF